MSTAWCWTCPEPWQAVATIGDALVMGGIMLSFLPTILQVHQLVMELNRDSRFQLVETVETLSARLACHPT